MTATNIRTAIVSVTCALYILLFVYAASSKMLDFENFRVQLGQSSLLGAFAGILVWLVPLTEIALAVGLCFRATRFWSLYGAFALMVMFTAYLYIMLHYSSYVPCSCGGILEKLGWTEHLVFNMAFTVLAIIGLALCESGSHRFILIANLRKK